MTLNEIVFNTVRFLCAAVELRGFDFFFLNVTFSAEGVRKNVRCGFFLLYINVCVYIYIYKKQNKTHNLNFSVAVAWRKG